MKVQEIIDTLEEKGFNRKEKNTGIYFSRTIENIKLICYVEPDVEVQFITLYQWRNNEVKGTYNISMKELGLTRQSLAELIKKTKENLPQEIGYCVDTHKEVDEVVDSIF